MFDFFGKLNNQDIKISRSKLHHNNLKYVNLYSRSCYELYDLNYISTPSIFLEDEFLNVLCEEFPEDIKLLTAGMNKMLIREKDYIDYIISVSDNDEFKNMLKIYRDIITAENAFKSYTDLIKHAHIRKTFEYTIVHSKIMPVEGIRNINAIPLDTDTVRDLFYVEDGYKVVDYNLGKIWLKGIAKRIGVSEEEFSDCESNNKSLFSDNLTFEDDYKYVKYIISGDVVTQSKNTKLLHDYLNNLYLYNQSNKLNTTFKEQVFADISEELDNYIEALRTNAEDELLDFYITSFDIYFKTPLRLDDFYFDESDSSDFKEGHLIDDIIPFGYYVFDTVNQEALDISNILSGVSGEFVCDKYINKNLYDTVGLPVNITSYTSRGNPITKSYYPIFNIKSKGKNSFYPYFGYKQELLINKEEVVTNARNLCRQIPEVYTLGKV